MKKSILMAIVALVLLAAPAFAGDYSITANFDAGWGWGLVDKEDVPNANKMVNDYTQIGFYGSVDDFNSLAITMEYGTTGSGMNINTFDAHTTLDARGWAVLVTEAALTTDILGSFGLTDLPVTLSMTNAFGRCNLHNRFQQWTGWEIKRWKDNGAAHFGGDWSGSGYNPAAWERVGYMKFTIGIMDMVNVAIGIVPLFGSTYADGTDVKGDVPMMVEAWGSAAVGPVALDIAGNLRKDADQIRTGIQVTGNMAFGALSLLVYLGDDLNISTLEGADGYDNLIAIAVKPSYGFGAGSVALGAWVTMDMMNDGSDTETQIDTAIDVALNYSSFTLYGGVIITDLTDWNENDESPMKYDIGVKNSFGAATIGVGVTGMAGTEDGTGTVLDQYDIGAADGSGNNWLDADNNAAPTVYLRASVWY
jgi:hypothetical protein